MKEMSDKEIQQLLENGTATTNTSNEDVEAYEFVFEALNKKPAEGLPMNFAQKVSGSIQAAKDRRISFIWYVLFPFALLVPAGVIYLYLGWADANTASVFIAAFMKYKWAFIFGSACFLLIEYLDRKLVRS